jgi:uncharacterized protein YdhG (YjbR/CyaY superfamily)
MEKASTVDEYYDGLSGDTATLLAELRRLGRAAAPAATEAIKWRHPAFVHPAGTILFMFSAHKSHVNVVFTPSTHDAFAGELTGFETGKGSVKLPYGSAVPAELLQRMMTFRIREFEDDGVKWM